MKSLLKEKFVSILPMIDHQSLQWPKTASSHLSEQGFLFSPNYLSLVKKSWELFPRHNGDEYLQVTFMFYKYKSLDCFKQTMGSNTR